MKLIERYICEACYCEIGNSSGKNNLGTNILDAVVYLGYLAITIGTLWTDGITTLPFYATVLVIARSLFVQDRMAKSVTKKGKQIAPAYQDRIANYRILIGITCVTFALAGSDLVGKVLISICYAVVAIYEFTDILIDCYEAKPVVYKI